MMADTPKQNFVSVDSKTLKPLRPLAFDVFDLQI